MKIEFESSTEIQELCALLQEIYPAALCVTVDDLTDARDEKEDAELPWNWDGYHPTLRKCMPSDQNKEHTGERLYTHEEVFGRGTVWEEITVKGRRFLRRPIPADTAFAPEEDLIFLAGQLDAYFALVDAGVISMPTVAKITGQAEPYLVDLCRIWARRTANWRELDD